MSKCHKATIVRDSQWRLVTNHPQRLPLWIIDQHLLLKIILTYWSRLRLEWKATHNLQLYYRQKLLLNCKNLARILWIQLKKTLLRIKRTLLQSILKIIFLKRESSHSEALKKSASVKRYLGLSLVRSLSPTDFNQIFSSTGITQITSLRLQMP